MEHHQQPETSGKDANTGGKPSSDVELGLGSDGAVEGDTKPSTSLPKIFSDELPPCGYMPQLAFKNVIGRLRDLWFLNAPAPQASGQATDQTAGQNAFILEICKLVQDDLEAEAIAMPVGSQHGTVNRQPWRREDVFKFELRWAKYFVREAEALANSKVPNEMDKMYQEFLDNFRPIPGSLHLFIRNRLLKKNIDKQWKDWNGERRPEQCSSIERPSGPSNYGSEEDMLEHEGLPLETLIHSEGHGLLDITQQAQVRAHEPEDLTTEEISPHSPI